DTSRANNRLYVRLPPDSLVLMPTDPIFYIAACIAVTFLGLAKGGFAGVGLVATPLLSLVIPPVQAIAIVLPILPGAGRRFPLGLLARLGQVEREGDDARRFRRRCRRLGSGRACFGRAGAARGG